MINIRFVIIFAFHNNLIMDIYIYIIYNKLYIITNTS